MAKIFGKGFCGCDWCKKQNKKKDVVDTRSRKEKKLLGIKENK